MLLDSGSQRTYISEALARKLNLRRGEESEIMVTTFVSEKPRKQPTIVTTIDIMLKGGGIMNIKASIVPSICGTLTRCPIQYKSLQNWEYLWNEENLADSLPTKRENTTIELLIGNDYYLDFILPQEVEIQTGLYMLASKLGWILTGRTTEQIEGSTEASVLMLSYNPRKESKSSKRSKSKERSKTGKRSKSKERSQTRKRSMSEERSKTRKRSKSKERSKTRKRSKFKERSKSRKRSKERSKKRNKSIKRSESRKRKARKVKRSSNWRLGPKTNIIKSWGNHIKAGKVIFPTNRVVSRPLNLLYPLECPTDTNRDNGGSDDGYTCPPDQPTDDNTSQQVIIPDGQLQETLPR